MRNISYNIFGKFFTLNVFGESHGIAIGCIISGCPSGINISLKNMQNLLKFRKPGDKKYISSRKEFDKIKILSGVFQNKTTGMPITLLIYNYNQNYNDYNILNNCFRPGHADYTYWYKYGIRDYRGGGYSSGRLTSIIVASGSIAKQILYEKYNILFKGYINKLGNKNINFRSFKNINKKNLYLSNNKMKKKIKNYIKKLYIEGNSCSANIKFFIKNIPIGLGNPFFEKINANISYILMSINAIKGIEIGLGFNFIKYKCTKSNDYITPYGFISNNSGGILGGISNGEDIIFSIIVKPTSSIKKNIFTINKLGNLIKIKINGRHDACIGLRIIPIIESMLSLIIMDLILINF